ncbi:MAG TPA: mannanase [Bacteroidota bacterium]|nr:mannanase [Bacteroidota bacterium]
MKHLTVIIVSALGMLFAGCAGMWPFSEHEGYVKVQGSHFTLNDRPYYYAGTNLWYGAYLGSPGATGDRPRLKRELDSLSELGVTNLRILAGSEYSHKIRSVKPAILRSPESVDDSLLLGLDFVLAEMAKRKMKAVLYLTNYWEWSGGMSQYVAWADSTPTLDPEVDGWAKFMNYSAGFYRNEKANALFRAYVKRIVTRVNTFNGRMYMHDPSIMSWQLANEPRPGTDGPEGEANIPSYSRWIDQTAAYLHSLDTNHLVSSGNEGLAGSVLSQECYLTAHASRSIDYLTMHVWPLNWGWFDPKRFEQTLPSSQEKAIAYIGKHLGYARALNKPIVLEEFGLGRDTGAFAPGSPTTARDRYFKCIYGVIYDSARAGSPMAGSNFWAWGGEGRTQNADYMWKAGDSFVGDPPQEPQGVNSIFDTDRSTLSIITAHARLMNRLGSADSLSAQTPFVKR